MKNLILFVLFAVAISACGREEQRVEPKPIQLPTELVINDNGCVEYTVTLPVIGDVTQLSCPEGTEIEE